MRGKTGAESWRFRLLESLRDHFTKTTNPPPRVSHHTAAIPHHTARDIGIQGVYNRQRNCSARNHAKTHCNRLHAFHLAFHCCAAKLVSAMESKVSEGKFLLRLALSIVLNRCFNGFFRKHGAVNFLRRQSFKRLHNGGVGKLERLIYRFSFDHLSRHG